MHPKRIEELNVVYMRIAKLYSGLSRGIRAKVGACLVTENGVLLPGFNGTPSGTNNDLEFVNEDGEYVTKPCVIHAELNCTLKAAREGISIKNGSAYITHSPCEQCAAMLLQAGIKAVYYGQIYKNDNGVRLLDEAGIFTRLMT